MPKKIREMINEMLEDVAVCVLHAPEGSEPLDYREWRCACPVSTLHVLAVWQQLQRYMAVPAGQLSMLESVDYDVACIGQGTAYMHVQ